MIYGIKVYRFYQKGIDKNSHKKYGNKILYFFIPNQSPDVA